MMCSHRFIRALGKGNHLKLKISHVSIKFHRDDENKAMSIKNGTEAELDIVVSKRKTR